MATEPLLGANASKVAVAISTVVIFGTLAIFIYPALYQLNVHYQGVPFTEKTFGIFARSTIHEVAQVVTAGHAVSSQTENAAVISKMIRVMMLAPFLMLLAAYLRRSPLDDIQSKAGKVPVTVPWFTVIFIAVAGFNSFDLLPVALVNFLIALDTVLLAMAMTALGLTTHISAIRQAGFKPILLALLPFIWLMIGGIVINQCIHYAVT